jgi:hypothetical protein
MHEIAHFLTREHDHNAAFYAKARELGVTANEGSKSLVMALANRHKMG